MISGYVEVEEPQSLNDFFKQKVALPQKMITKKLLSKTKKLNPEVENFDSLNPGTFLYIEIPYKEGVKLAVPPNIADAELSKKKRDENPPWLISAFYTASLGTFEEKIEGVEIKSNQDSPITLGLSGLYNYRPEIFLSGSFYISYLDPSRSNSNVTNAIPPEYGLTGHVNWDKEGRSYVLFGGLELEKFSTFNIQDVANSEEIDVRNHNVIYASAGISKNFEMFKRKFLFKGSLGKSVVSKADDGAAAFEGFKYILFLTAPLKGKWGVHSFFKQHFLSGPSELNVTRIGAGVSYTFF